MTSETPQYNPNSQDSMLTRIDTTLQGLAADMKLHVASTEKRFDQVEGDVETLRGRVEKLEGAEAGNQVRWLLIAKLIGGVTAAGAGGAGLLQLLQR